LAPLKKRIQVLHVVLSLEPGGMENGLTNVANRLPESEFETRVCCLLREGAFAERLKSGTLLRSLEKPPGFSWRAVKHLAALVREWQPDIIHTHNIGTLIYTALALPGMSGCVLLHGEHAEFSASDLSFKRRLQRRLAYAAVDRLVPVSISLAEHLVAHGANPKKIVAIPNGVDTDRFHAGDRAAVRRKLQLPEESFVIGNVGRFGEFKRQDMLVESFDLLAANEPKAHLLLVGGGGPMEQRVRDRVAASPYKARIHLTGFQADTRDYYRAMDILVIASTCEGLSNAALEAMATEVPVLCHTSCGASDIIENGRTGQVLAMNVAADIADQVMGLMDRKKELQTIGQAAREYILKHHSIQHMVDSYAALYREVLHP
jgi:glycosyltransferase involved in cell wall biosynthesis